MHTLERLALSSTGTWYLTHFPGWETKVSVQFWKYLPLIRQPVQYLAWSLKVKLHWPVAIFTYFINQLSTWLSDENLRRSRICVKQCILKSFSKTLASLPVSLKAISVGFKFLVCDFVYVHSMASLVSFEMDLINPNTKQFNPLKTAVSFIKLEQISDFSISA